MTKILSLIMLCFFLTGNISAQNKLDSELKNLLQTTTGSVGVIVTFHGNTAPTPAHLQLLNTLGITKGVTFKSLPIAGVLATATQIAALEQNSAVRSIYLNKKLSYFNYNGTHLTGVRKLRTDKEMIARNNGMPVSGKGVGVMINDSGVDGTHDDLKFGTHLVQNVLGATNLNSLDAMLPVTWLENVPNTDNNSGHGTHCAGSVGGTGAKSGGLYEGAAPGAHLIGYGSGAALFVLDAIGGFDYALTHQYQYGIRVISNSWGTSGDFDPNNPVNVASKMAYDRGIVSLFAAGNEGPSSDTHNPYAIAPWVISVGAGDKDGRLADFSSRGVKGEGGTFTMDGETWTYENRPTIVAPGVDIVSTRVIGPVASLEVQQDVEKLDPAHVPFYTHMSGTSMATPHAAGIVALLLEANPSLSPAQVKEILQKTATNMPGHESWEVGAGYVNAYAAVDHIFRNSTYGTYANYTRRFNSNVTSQSETTPFTIDYNPLLAANNQMTFTVVEGTNSIEAKISAGGLLGETGNPVNLILLGPDGSEHRAGIPVTFTLTYDRGVAVASPAPGQWILKVDGLNGIALPETINGTLNVQRVTGTTGLSDIAGHPAEASIKMAVGARLVDGLNGSFKPDEYLKRIQLADYLMMGQAIRQFMPTNGSVTFSDLKGSEVLLGESVAAKGAALRDRLYAYNGVMLPTSTGKFSPTGNVNRASLAYSLVQALGLQEHALARNGKTVTVTVDGKKIPVEDAKYIPAGLEGYVSVALELGLINAYYSVTQGPLDLFPTMHATFKPTQNVTRAEFAVIVTRTYSSWNAVTQPVATSTTGAMQVAQWEESYAYPNPSTGLSTISYSVSAAGPVSVEVFDVMGRKIQTLLTEKQAAGRHALQFDGSKLPSGTYLYRVTTNGKTSTNRMVITK
ncbi:S8 family serine peptidase [Pontibacter sp. BT310]|uniref:S8 family peptidase n=1 Tax=Pontibacter populi TaxID=890055 RepID=A0ABS6X726_9BACT|nr:MULTISPECIES: S8/S53 family peptidase [Pontibacter]MBJ6116952.1 S8 family serine peptidase [Pontibacter sp. BT310]MBR0569376.1 S8 family serine peptidase [Microvirga sp. STS03]MBW3363805.1 S8 family peptidase [Pontibacter populi]